MTPRWSIRIAPRSLDLIREAADLLGISASELVRRAALRKARKVIERKGKDETETRKDEQEASEAQAIQDHAHHNGAS